MRLLSTKFRHEVCDDLYWAPLPDGTFLSEELPSSPEGTATAERLLTLESMSEFAGPADLATEADKQITGFKRARAEEAKLDTAETDRESRRVAEINERQRQTINDQQARITALEAEIAQLKAEGAGGLRPQPLDTETTPRARGDERHEKKSSRSN